MKTENLSTLKINRFTTYEQYEKALNSGIIGDNEICLVPDGEGGFQEIVTEINKDVTDEQIPSAQAVYKLVQEALYVDEGATI